MSINDIKAREKSFHEIFNKEATWIIPVFQRGIEWNDEEVERLWKDLTEHYFKIEHEQTASSYLLGTIVVTDIDGGTAVLDGQQRFTAMTILLWALYSRLRPLLESLGDVDANKFDGYKKITADFRDYFIRFDVTPDDPVWVPLISYPDKSLTAFLRENLLKEKVLEDDYKDGYHNKKLTISQKNILSLFLKISDCVDSFIEKLRKDDINNLDLFNKLRNVSRIIVKHTCVVEVTVDKKRATQVFEALNNRGAKLEISDIVKVNFFQSLPSFEQSKMDVLADTWEALKNNFTSKSQGLNNFTSFIQYSAISRTAKFGKVLNFQKLNRDVVFSEGGLSKESELYNFKPSEFLDCLKVDLKPLLCLREDRKVSQLGGYEDVDELLANYRKVIGAANLAPFYLAAIRRYVSQDQLGTDHKKNAKTLCSILEMVENFVMREYKFSMQRLDSDALLKTSADLVYFILTIDEDSSLVEKIRSYLYEKLTEKNIVEQLKNYTNQSQKLNKSANNALNYYIQRKICAKLLKAGLREIVKQEINGHHLEHIAPQTPSVGDWPEFFPIYNNPETVGDFIKAIDRIGNHMMLWGKKNRKLQNAGYSKKWVHYKETAIELYENTIKPFEVNGNWTRQSIMERTAFMAEKAKELKVWDI